jgi:hypothetical protein
MASAAHRCAAEQRLRITDLREEHRLKLFKNRALRRIFGLRKERVT